ncbi:MAG: YdcF family protein [Bacilli bacterium]|jgi:uncharacterized SAM-binding protein YcdF (DUF218 family)|nr:YdcF family protein [Bacilli bacterium]
MSKKLLIGILVILFLIYIIPMFLVLVHTNDRINEELDYVIVLGAKVNGDQPSQSLQYRLDKTYQLSMNNNIKIIVTGGQGHDEKYPEAKVMKKYLVNKGIAQDRILVDDKSASTYQNLINARKIIEDENDNYKTVKIGIVTNDFHIFRSRMIAQRIFKQDIQMEASPNTTAFKGLYSLLREPLAFYKSWILDK